MASLTVEGLRIRFEDREVLKGVSFKCAPGEILAIIGPSGGGKTTLLRSILGEIMPDEGRVFLDGQDITHKKVWKRGVGIVYQRYALFAHMTVQDNIAYGLKVRGEANGRLEKRVTDLVEMVHLVGKEKMYPERLSGGERQRVAVARALAVEPRLLLLDEAFTALDATTRHRVIEEVRSIIRRLKLTTILVTHDQEEAFLFSTRVLVINDGAIVVDGSPDAVMQHKHPFIQDFVKMALFEKGTVEQDRRGLFVPLENGSKIPISIPGIRAGDAVQVMVKKTGETERIEVWRREPPEVVE